MLGILILLTFFVFAGLMITRKMSAIVALPLMAIVVALLPVTDPYGSLATVFGEGTLKLGGAITNVIFGAILAYVAYSSGIIETIVRKAAELAGDRPLVVALILAGACGFCFTAIEGLGATILVGTIMMPILISVGITPIGAACIFLASSYMGVLFNPYIWGYFSDLFEVEVAQVQNFALVALPALALFTVALIVFYTREGALRTAWAVRADSEAIQPEGEKSVPAYALLTPIIPVALLLVSRLGWFPFLGEATTFDINLGFLIASVYGCLTTRPLRIIDTLSAAVTEGIKTVAPVIGLMIGIGMLITALTAESVQNAMQPILQAVVPTSLVGFVLFFGLLAPLSVYRGPLNAFGLGAGLTTILVGLISPVMAMGALFLVSIVQAVSDPTNTHNVWTGQFTKTDTQDILRRTLPFAWSAAIVALLVSGFLFWGQSS